MARRLRYIPAPRTLVFITCRTVQGRFLFRPGPALNDLVLGVLGRCQRNHDLTLCAVTTLSSHFHILTVVEDAQQISGFMRDVKSKFAREVNRLTRLQESPAREGPARPTRELLFCSRTPRGGI